MTNTIPVNNEPPRSVAIPVPWDIAIIGDSLGEYYREFKFKLAAAFSDVPHFLLFSLTTDVDGRIPFIPDHVALIPDTTAYTNWNGSALTVYKGSTSAPGLNPGEVQFAVNIYAGGTFYIHVYDGANTKSFGPIVMPGEPCCS